MCHGKSWFAERQGVHRSIQNSSKTRASTTEPDGGLRQPGQLTIMQTGPYMWRSERDPAPQDNAKSAQAVTAYCRLTSLSVAAIQATKGAVDLMQGKNSMVGYLNVL